MTKAKNASAPKLPRAVETFKHDDKRRNLPTAELQSVMDKKELAPRTLRYPRNPDLDPQLVWRGKDEQDWSDLVVQVPPLYIQEKVHPRMLIDDLLRQTQLRAKQQPGHQLDLFGDFNGVPDGDAKTEFYQHDQHWTNRMVLGDSLQVMASLAEREGLRGQVQCIYLDPPYGIKFNSNFQWSTTSRDVKDGNAAHITREPEQVKAFRDTWRDGIHSYLTYLRDRLTVARDLLTESGSVFVQIGDENVHRVRAVMDEVFGDENFVSQIVVAKTTGSTDDYLGQTTDYLLWYSRSLKHLKYRPYHKRKFAGEVGGTNYNRARDIIGQRFTLNDELVNSKDYTNGDIRIYSLGDLTSQSAGREKGEGAASWFGVKYLGREFKPSMTVRWKTNELGMSRLLSSNRIEATAQRIGYVRYLDDFPAIQINNRWDDVGASFMSDKVYVVQTSPTIIQRCLLMSTDPGDLVLDPTCGSGTTAYVAEQWGRRWITVDTSRVALALARARIMGARYPYYLLADSPEGQRKEGEVTRTMPKTSPTQGSVRQGFVYERVPHITLKSITNNAEIDVIWDKWQETLEPLRVELNAALGQQWEEWEVPREALASWPTDTAALHADWWTARISRQREIDASIAAKAESESLYDRPYEDKKRVRVAGPFTVESVLPHRMLGVDEDGELIDPAEQPGAAEGQSFESMILENLRTAGVQQADKSGKITFTALTPWPGDRVSAEGLYLEGEGDDAVQRRAAVLIGPEFGTVQRSDLVDAAREAAEGGFDLLIACAFSFEAHTTEFSKLGRLPVIKARMNADLHMGGDLKPTGTGNLFVVFGEPDIDVLDAPDDQVQVKVNGVDVFHPSTGDIRSDNADGIACWFVDTNYNAESFFVRQAYFLGAQDPYNALKTTLKADIDAEAWASLNSDTSRPFDKPQTGRIAVKVINHLGDEVMKVYRVE